MSLLTRCLLILVFCAAQMSSLVMAGCVHAGQTSVATDPMPLTQSESPEIPPCHSQGQSSQGQSFQRKVSEPAIQIADATVQSPENCCLDHCPCPALGVFPISVNSFVQCSRAAPITPITVMSPRSLEQTLLRPPIFAA